MCWAVHGYFLALGANFILQTTPMHSVNQLLVERLKAYFKKYYGLELSDETAEEYLESLAGLIAVIAESGGGKSPPATLVATGTTTPLSDLIIASHKK